MNNHTIEFPRLQFSGHETFACKQFWLKKGYDYVVADKSFANETAVVDLGVGKNMVSSIRYWLKSFGIIEDSSEVTTDFGDFIFGENGVDPYLEDIATLWLLHYALVRRQKASIYSLLFNEFRKERNEFTREQLDAFIRRRCEETQNSSKYNENTVGNDITVMFRSYLRPTNKTKLELEESVSNMFLDLGLVNQFYKTGYDNKAKEWYRIETRKKVHLPASLVLFAILDNYPDQQTISFRQLLASENSPGNVFALTAEDLHDKIMDIVKQHDGVVYSETAGNQVFQLKREFNKWEVLNGYYNA